MNNWVMRYTLSSLLNRLIEGEKFFRDKFIQVSSEVKDGNIKRYLEENIKDGEKRIEELEWIKGFLVVEMTLEPIIGPNLLEYINTIVKSIENARVKEDFIKVEKLRIDTYKEAIALLKNVSPEAADLLQGFIKRSEKLILTLYFL